MDYARLYAEFAPKMMNKDEQDNIATMYAKNDGSDDGFFVCYRPNHQSDINKAFELFIDLAKRSSVQALAVA